MARRWGKLEKDFLPKTCVFDISKIPDIYDCIKYDVEHNRAVLIHSEAWKVAVQLYTNVKHLADVVIPQEYGMTRAEKLTIAQGICTPLLKKIKADLQRNIEQTEEAEDDIPDDWRPDFIPKEWEVGEAGVQPDVVQASLGSLQEPSEDPVTSAMVRFRSDHR